ncbi:hypothetical protein ACFC5Z_02045 [Streptomyces sp. NPDC056004]|uniref:hypothetical protein n=1 Tax=Streptomyces sp. NPDC056004 TaxID=3345677 RepID=UPI0035E10E14
MADQELEEQGGWWTSPSTGSVAVVTGVVRRLAWGLLIAGPVLGGWAIVSQPGADRPAPVVQASSSDVAGPGGFAEMYVAAFLRAGEGSQDELAAFYSGARDLELGGKPDAVQVGQIAAVRVGEIAPGRYWSVTVAARVLEPAASSASSSAGGGQPVLRMRFFQVPVEADREGGPLAALALPAEVAAPTGGTPQAELAYGRPLPAQASDPAVDTLSQFFAAYLSGSGELGRYLSPGTRLSPVRPARTGRRRSPRSLSRPLSGMAKAMGGSVPRRAGSGCAWWSTSGPPARTASEGRCRTRSRWPAAMAGGRSPLWTRLPRSPSLTSRRRRRPATRLLSKENPSHVLHLVGRGRHHR